MAQGGPYIIIMFFIRIAQGGPYTIIMFFIRMAYEPGHILL